ncbi:MAG: LamG domain-containing protein [Acidobacteriota bacterium]
MTTVSIGVATLGLLGVGTFSHHPVNGQDARGFIEEAGEQKNGDITTGLVSHWPMDEGSDRMAKDVVSGNHCVFERGEPQWVKGRIGKGALSFSESCYLNCGKGESLNMTKAMTFAAWIKKPQDGRKSRIASKHGFIDETNAGWLVLCGGVDKDNIEWRISVTGRDWHGGFTTPKSFPYDQWNHLAVTYDGAVMRAYINGVEDTGGDFPHKVGGPIHVSNAETLLGQDRAHGQVFGGPQTWSFTGGMDDARIYNRALSAKDIKALFTHRGASWSTVNKRGPCPKSGRSVSSTRRSRGWHTIRLWPSRAKACRPSGSIPPLPAMSITTRPPTIPNSTI